MNIMWKNRIDDGSLTASSTATNFPVTNIQHIHLSNVWRSDLETDVNIVFDLDGEYDVSSISIGGHNLSSSATITLEANDSDSWTTPAFSQSITWREDALVDYLSSTQTYQYWRLVISDAANVDNYIEIGRVFLGTYLEMPPIERDYTFNINSTSSRKSSISGQIYGDSGYSYTSLQFDYPLISDSERQDIEEMYRSVNITNPVFIDVFSETPDIIAPFYGVIDDTSLKITHNTGGGLYWTTSFTFSEVR